jgi:nucleotidyltransferase substrate binding protein (TIGR01987 family)
MTKLESLIEDLTKANQRLKEASELEPTRIHKDATIQRFEFTFELAWKTIQEYVRDQGLDCKSPKNCFRTAAEIDLMKNPEVWFEYLEARNLIAHTYNERLADKVYRQAVKFCAEVDNLLKVFK